MTALVVVRREDAGRSAALLLGSGQPVHRVAVRRHRCRCRRWLLAPERDDRPVGPSGRDWIATPVAPPQSTSPARRDHEADQYDRCGLEPIPDRDGGPAVRRGSGHPPMDVPASFGPCRCAVVVGPEGWPTAEQDGAGPKPRGAGAAGGHRWTPDSGTRRPRQRRRRSRRGPAPSPSSRRSGRKRREGRGRASPAGLQCRQVLPRVRRRGQSGPSGADRERGSRGSRRQRSRDAAGQGHA